MIESKAKSGLFKIQRESLISKANFMPKGPTR